MSGLTGSHQPLGSFGQRMREEVERLGGVYKGLLGHAVHSNGEVWPIYYMVLCREIILFSDFGVLQCGGLYIFHGDDGAPFESGIARLRQIAGVPA